MDRRTRRALHQFAANLPSDWGDQLLERVGLTSRRQENRTIWAVAITLVIALIAAAVAIVAGRAADNVD